MTILVWFVILVLLRVDAGLSIANGQIQLQYMTRDFPNDSTIDPLIIDLSTHVIQTSIFGGAILLSALVGGSLALVNGTVFLIRRGSRHGAVSG